MTKTFTRNDVLRYFYREVSKIERQEIEEFLSCNRILLDYYCSLNVINKKMVQLYEQPKSSSIQNILEYSKSLCLHN